jgi:simple sugar transport system permease protein
MGAFFGFLTAWLTDSAVVGVLGGLGAGMVTGALMAFLAVQAQADQIVVGIGLNIAALGVTGFTFRQIFTGPQTLLHRPGRISIPGLSNVPFLGEAVFRQPVMVYLALATAPLVWFLLYRTRWGLSIRAAGEVPEAVEAAGESTARARWAGTLLAGALAGVGGAFLSVELGVFIEGMTAGRGFLAIAAVIFGRWRPVGVLAACLVFGAADALQLRLQSEAAVSRSVWLVFALVGPAYLLFAWRARRVHRWPLGRWAGLLIPTLLGLVLFATAPSISLPAQLWRTVPYFLSLAMLASVIGRSRMPTALAIPFRRGGASH